MTTLDKQALEKAADKLLDELIEAEGGSNAYHEMARVTIATYLAALPPDNHAAQIDRIELKVDRIETRLASMSGLISNYVKAVS